jgi:uncharacterized protein (DUF697 family)
VLVSGAPGQARVLHQVLVEGGDENAVRDLSGRKLTRYDVQGAEVLVHFVEGSRPSKEDEEALRLAHRNDVELVCVLVGEASGDAVDVPYVLATDVVSVAPADPLPISRIVERIAERAGANSYVLAARLPRLRRPVCEDIVSTFARQNGILGAAIFIPGADLPTLTLNQIRMVFRIASAYGEEIDRERALELIPVIGAGFGLRAVARQFLGLVPFAGWAVKGGIAFVGTRALGEAAIAYFEAGGARAVKETVRSVRSRS